jgi:ferric-dicitrate binding protein FerR (iron transport regulator)
VENYKELLLKYLQNECNREEMVSIINWLKNPQNEKLIDQFLLEDWSMFEGKEIRQVLQNNESFSILKQRILALDANKFNQSKHKIRRIVFRIAASFLLPVGIGYLTFCFFQKNIKPEPIVYNEITAPLGSKTTIQLGDGTKVWLNSGSKLKIPQRFVGNYRQVELTGEAYFDVKKDPSHPFIVKTSKLNIKVLGTTFDVKAYPEEGTIETTLVNGLVTITKTNQSLNDKNAVYLKPKQRATFVKETGTLMLAESEKKLVKKEIKINVDKKREEKMICTKNVDTEPFVAWKDDKLVFKNEDFESLCVKLKRWYGVEINIKSEALKKYHYTGILQKETINDVIEILRLTMPFSYDINHNVIDLWSADEKKPI